MAERPSYSLAMSDQEVDRYRVMAQMARSTEADRWAAAGIVEGAAIADLGCGPGLVLAELADIVGSRGRVCGVDRQAEALATAAALIERTGIPWASVTEADAWASGLPAGTFDVVNIRHVLAHNTPEDQARILRHAFELLRPGGTIYLLDVDLDGGRLDPPDADIQDLMDRYVAHLIDTGRVPHVGPHLGSALRAAGFDAVERWGTIQVPPSVALTTVRPPAWAARDAMIASGHATAADVDRWDAALTAFAATAVADQRAFLMPLFYASGTKPTD
jgi:ubiquinone/menaquinone biosynthesis C-methylase UbiE